MAKLKIKKQKKSLFNEEKGLVGLTQELGQTKKLLLELIRKYI
jgi:hypothetical protein